jgi:phospholipid/cholesterol/gamma-HCH transport system substrate-binding protein
LKITREIKTAILVIASILLFIWGYSFLKGSNLFNSHKKLYVEYDNVEGLASGAAVTISGKVIGKVNTIQLSNNGKLSLELQINEDDFPISKTSIAQIYEPGFIGGKQIAIIPNYKDQNIAVSGDKLIAEIKLGMFSTVGEKLVPTQQKIDNLVVDADQLMKNLNDILDVKARENLKNSLANLNEVLVQFKSASVSVNGMLAENKTKIGNSLTNVEKASANFSKVSDSIAKLSLSKTVKNLEKTLANVDKIMAEMQSGKGTIGKLMKDETMYNNFSKTSKELELLLQDLRLHPTRYVNVSLFGKKNKPYVGPITDSLK